MDAYASACQCERMCACQCEMTLINIWLTMYMLLLGPAACIVAIVYKTSACVSMTVKQTVSCCCGCSLLYTRYAGMSWQVLKAEAHLGHTVSPSPVHQLAQMAVALGQCSAKTAVFQPATQQGLAAIKI